MRLFQFFTKMIEFFVNKFRLGSSNEQEASFPRLPSISIEAQISTLNYRTGK